MIINNRSINDSPYMKSYLAVCNLWNYQDSLSEIKSRYCSMVDFDQDRISSLERDSVTTSFRNGLSFLLNVGLQLSYKSTSGLIRPGYSNKAVLNGVNSFRYFADTHGLSIPERHPLAYIDRRVCNALIEVQNSSLCLEQSIEKYFEILGEKREEILPKCKKPVRSTPRHGLFYLACDLFGNSKTSVAERFNTSRRDVIYAVRKFKELFEVYQDLNCQKKAVNQ